MNNSGAGVEAGGLVRKPLQKARKEWMVVMVLGTVTAPVVLIIITVIHIRFIVIVTRIRMVTIVTIIIYSLLHFKVNV